MVELRIVSNVGYQALTALGSRHPEFFTQPDIDRLREEMPRVVREDSQDRMWAETISLETSLEPMNENPSAGPVDDARHAVLLAQALPNLGPKDWHNERLWASINCFALDRYIPVRWSNARTRRTVEREFVANHWLRANTANRESNTGMRLFTLHTLAQRIAQFSQHTIEELLQGMAGAGNTNVGLFHQSLRRPYLLANSRLMAILWDLVLEDSNQDFLTRVSSSTEWLSGINERGGAVDLGVVDDDGLRAIVEETRPRPKAGS